MNTRTSVSARTSRAEALFEGRDHLWIDNTHLSAADVAGQVVEALGL